MSEPGKADAYTHAGFRMCVNYILCEACKSAHVDFRYVTFARFFFVIVIAGDYFKFIIHMTLYNLMFVWQGHVSLVFFFFF